MVRSAASGPWLAGAADRHMLTVVDGQPALVAGGVQIPRVVERDRLQEHRDRAVGRGGGDAGAQQRGGVVTAARAGHHQSGDVAQHTDRVVVVEVPAESLLVRQSRDPHHQRVPVAALGEEGQRGGLAAELVLGVVQVGQVLDLRDRQQPGQPGAQSTRPRIDCSSRMVSKTRARPNRRDSPRVTPYTPPLPPTSSPKTVTRPSASSSSASVALIDSARVRRGPVPVRRRRPVTAGPPRAPPLRAAGARAAPSPRCSTAAAGRRPARRRWSRPRPGRRPPGRAGRSGSPHAAGGRGRCPGSGRRPARPPPPPGAR